MRVVSEQEERVSANDRDDLLLPASDERRYVAMISNRGQPTEGGATSDTYSHVIDTLTGTITRLP